MCSYVNAYNGSLLWTHIQQNIRIFWMIPIHANQNMIDMWQYKNLSPKNIMQITQLKFLKTYINDRKQVTTKHVYFEISKHKKMIWNHTT
jgi:hypothetical protein